ncbi:hypothetical protein [Thermogemmatispora carboxidivorans]|uniref:hypothetical protein n=1 Tax=Thermogemmatispora carboxidivorans TaxID=1382306 RepID=UPI00069A26DD|nr:hypothetical protein [Thermogemmatispora carboxidivorans]
MSRESKGPRWSEEPEEDSWPGYEEGLPPGRRAQRRAQASDYKATYWQPAEERLRRRRASQSQGQDAEEEVVEEVAMRGGRESLLFAEEEEPSSYRGGHQTAYLRRRKRRGHPWLWFLGGCSAAIFLLLLGIAVAVFAALRSVTGSSPLPILGPTLNTYTQTNQQTIPINNLQQLKVSSQIGSVDIAVDSSLSAPELTIIKQVKAGGQAEADEEFKRISVQIQPGLTSLQVTTTLPQSEGLNGPNDTVNLRFKLPTQVNQGATPFELNVELAVGDVHIQGLNGMLVVENEAGNITVDRAILTNGSSLRTVNGQVTFNGSLDTRPVGNGRPLFQIHSEVGQLDVTLPASIAVVVDAYVNSGKIVSAFPIQVSTNAGSATYYGPLVPGSGPTPTALLRLDVGTGTINLHSA